MSKFQELTGQGSEKLRAIGDNYTALKGNLMESARQSARDFLGVQPHEITAIEYEEDAEKAIQDTELHTAETMRDADIAIQELRDCDPIDASETDLQRLNSTVDARLNAFDEREREVRAIPSTIATSHKDIQELGQLENTVQTLTAEVQASTPPEQSAPNEGITAIGRRIQVWSEVDAVRSTIFTARMNEYVRTREEPTLKPQDSWDVPQCIRAIQEASTPAKRKALAVELGISNELATKIIAIADSDVAVGQAQENAAKEAELNQKKQQLAETHAKLDEYSDLAERIKILHESRIQPVAENVVREKAKRAAEAQQVRVHIVDKLTQTRSEAVAMMGWRLSTNELKSLMDSSVVLPVELNEVALGSLLAGGPNEKLVNEILRLVQQLQEQIKDPVQLDQSVAGILNEVRGGNSADVLVRLLASLMTECGQSDAQLAGELSQTIPSLEPTKRQVVIGAGLDPSHKALQLLTGGIDSQRLAWEQAQVYVGTCAQQAVHLKERVAMCDRKVPIVGGVALAPIDMGSFGTSAEIPTIQPVDAELSRIKAEIFATLQKTAQPDESKPTTQPAEARFDIRTRIVDLKTEFNELAKLPPDECDLDRMVEVATDLRSIYNDLGATEDFAMYDRFLITLKGLKQQRELAASAVSGPPAEVTKVIPELTQQLSPLIEEARQARQRGDNDLALEWYRQALLQAEQYGKEHPDSAWRAQVDVLEEEMRGIRDQKRDELRFALASSTQEMVDTFTSTYENDRDTSVAAFIGQVRNLQPLLQNIYAIDVELDSILSRGGSDNQGEPNAARMNSALNRLFDPVVRRLVEAHDDNVFSVIDLRRQLLSSLIPETAQTKRMIGEVEPYAQTIRRVFAKSVEIRKIMDIPDGTRERAQALESLADDLAQSTIAAERMKAIDVYTKSELAYYSLGQEEDRRRVLDISIRRQKLQEDLGIIQPTAYEFELVGTMIQSQGPPFDHKESINLGDGNHVEVGIDEHRKPDPSNPLPRVWIYDDKVGGEALPIQPTPDGQEVRSGDYGGLILVAEALPLKEGQWLVRAHIMRRKPSDEPAPPEAEAGQIEALALAVGGTPLGPPGTPRVEGGAQPPPKPPKPGDGSPDGDGDGIRPPVESLPLNPTEIKIGEPNLITVTAGEPLTIPVAGSPDLSITFDSNDMDFDIGSNQVGYHSLWMASIHRRNLKIIMRDPRDQIDIIGRLGISGYAVSEISAITRNEKEKRAERISFTLTLLKKEVAPKIGVSATPLPLPLDQPLAVAEVRPQIADYEQLARTKIINFVQNLPVGSEVRNRIQGPLEALYGLAGRGIDLELDFVREAARIAGEVDIPYLSNAVIAMAELIQAAVSARDGQTGEITPESLHAMCDHLVNWLAADLRGMADLAEFIVAPEIAAVLKTAGTVDGKPNQLAVAVVQPLVRRLRTRNTNNRAVGAVCDILEGLLSETGDQGILTQVSRELVKTDSFRAFMDKLRQHITPEKEVPKPVAPVEQAPIVIRSGTNLLEQVKRSLSESDSLKEVRFSISPEVFQQFLPTLVLPMGATINRATRVSLSQNGPTNVLNIIGSFDAKGGNSTFDIAVGSKNDGKLYIVGEPVFKFATRHSLFSGKIRSSLTNLSVLLEENINKQLVNKWSVSRIDIANDGIQLSVKRP